MRWRYVKFDCYLLLYLLFFDGVNVVRRDYWNYWLLVRKFDDDLFVCLFKRIIGMFWVRVFYFLFGKIIRECGSDIDLGKLIK